MRSLRTKKSLGTPFAMIHEPTTNWNPLLRKVGRKPILEDGVIHSKEVEITST
jgi:hypothetical protein